MALSNLTLSAFPPFSLDEYSTISTRWTKYKKRFENFALALSAQDAAQKKALSLNCLGDEVCNAYENLSTGRLIEKYDAVVALASWTDIFRHKIILHMNVMSFKMLDKMYIKTFISFT